MAALDELKVMYADVMTEIMNLQMKAKEIKAGITKESSGGVEIREKLEWKGDNYRLRYIDVVPVFELLDGEGNPTGKIVYCNDPSLIAKLTA